MTVLYVVVGLLVGVIVGFWLGSRKNMPLVGAVLGLLGIIGWIIMILLPKRTLNTPVADGAVVPPPSAQPANLPSSQLPHHPDDVVDLHGTHPDGTSGRSAP